MRLAGDGTHAVIDGKDPVVSGLTLDEAENDLAFVRAAARVRRRACGGRTVCRRRCAA